MSRQTHSISVATTTPPASGFQTLTNSHPTPTTNTVIANSVLPTTTASPSHWSPPTNATAAESEAPRTMKAAQIAGLSVAAAATFIIAIGLMVLSVCLRRRKEQRRVVEMIDEKRPASITPRKASGRFSRRFAIKSQQPPIPQLKLPRKAGVGLTSLAGYSDPYLARAHPRTQIYTVQTDTLPPRADPFDLNATHPALRPGAGGSSSHSKTSLPLEQIGLAISAELPERSLPATRPPRFPMRVSSRQQRPKSVVVPRPENPSQRPDSVMTQDTVFEEDAPPERRRSSRLLPTPPIPIPPIRSFQPSRPPPSLQPFTAPKKTPLNRQQTQQPELFLNIPIRHSRTQPLPVPLADMRQQASSKAPDTSQDILPLYDQYKSTPAKASTPEIGNDIPDYYFLSNRSSPSQSVAKVPTNKGVPTKGSNPRLKSTSSNVSRATSTASTNPRDSISSQTSFETVDPDDPTPEEEDEDRQLAQGGQLSPVAESPISNLRYPKVPRASNQLVPRSPKSPQSVRSDQSFRSPRHAPEPSSLLVKRRGEQEAMKLGGRLHMATTGSPNMEAMRANGQQYRQHGRSNSSDTVFSSNRSSERHRRSQSGQWPMSPARYQAELDGLKSPAWVPELTPKRHGEDLLISVSYSKPKH